MNVFKSSDFVQMGLRMKPAVRAEGDVTHVLCLCVESIKVCPKAMKPRTSEVTNRCI